MIYGEMEVNENSGNLKCLLYVTRRHRYSERNSNRDDNARYQSHSRKP